MTTLIDPAAEYACRTLITDFAEFVDNHEYERLREVFTDDALYARPTAPDAPIRGVEAIVEGFRSRSRDRITLHLLSNVYVRFESAQAATGGCRIVLYTGDATQPQSGGRGRPAGASQLIGLYADRYVATPRGWRIAERRGRVLLHT